MGSVNADVGLSTCPLELRLDREAAPDVEGDSGLAAGYDPDHSAVLSETAHVAPVQHKQDVDTARIGSTTLAREKDGADLDDIGPGVERVRSNGKRSEVERLRQRVLAQEVIGAAAADGSLLAA